MTQISTPLSDNSPNARAETTAADLEVNTKDLFDRVDEEAQSGNDSGVESNRRSAFSPAGTRNLSSSMVLHITQKSLGTLESFTHPCPMV